MSRSVFVSFLLLIFSLKSFANDLSEIENYLNDIKTLKANFLQLDVNGTLAEGSITISKPGKFKWDYQSQPIQIISDGKTIVFYDKELKQSNFLDVDDSIASLLAEENLSINDDLNVIDFSSTDNGSYLTVSKPNKKDVKQMRLYFSHNPLMISKIDVLDYNNNKIEINLFDIVLNQKISKSEFIVKDQRLN
ncbi:MAG: outer membrane lipoprotein carrier protein LolA [Rickettsiales bacterium]|nr:outer membrane lipoprotein carrier protein LolA [Rickettsiales bacterium]